MRNAIFALIFLILIIALVGLVRQQLAPKARLALAALLGALVLCGVVYYKQESAHQSATDELVGAFGRGEMLVCGGLNVSRQTHRLELGTQSFIAKDEKNFRGTNIAMAHCKVAK